jgi:hypothetical protein
MATLNYDPDGYLRGSDDPVVSLLPFGGLEIRTDKSPKREYRERIRGPPSENYDLDIDSRE